VEEEGVELAVLAVSRFQILLICLLIPRFPSFLSVLYLGVSRIVVIKGAASPGSRKVISIVFPFLISTGTGTFF
jgi:hypothetical protein